MTEYIKETITVLTWFKDNDPTKVFQRYGKHKLDFASLLKATGEELDRLDPRDFEPSARQDFVTHRAQMRAWCVNIPNDRTLAISTAEDISKLLDHYVGLGTGAKTRDFSFVLNSDIRRITERDYRELSMRAFPDGAWKSTVILAGSILEAVLYDRLTKDTETTAQAMASGQAPRKKNGVVKDITQSKRSEEWTLDDFIKVACNLKILPYENEQAVHLALRKFRNFVHPRLEVTTGMAITEGHATASKGMLDVILDHLSSQAP